VVSYNGKTFDAQILRNRCLMQGISPPVFPHLDLLYSARRLWRRILPDCSQARVETEILSLNREGDLPGAFAPEAWFDFLKSGETAALVRICDHNARDILGLASLFGCLCRIAADPLGALEYYRYDLEALALRWRDWVRRGETGPAGREMGARLLRAAGNPEYPRAALALARDLMGQGACADARGRLREVAGAPVPEAFRAAACRALAIDAEWRLKDPGEALEWVNRCPRGPAWDNEFAPRRERLLKKAGPHGTVRGALRGAGPP
jgi:hypothetical protein